MRALKKCLVLPLVLAAVSGGSYASDIARPEEAIRQFLEFNAKGRLNAPEARAVNATASGPTLGRLSWRPGDLAVAEGGLVVARVTVEDPSAAGPTNGYLVATRGIRGEWRVTSVRGLRFVLLPQDAKAISLGFQGNQRMIYQHGMQTKLGAQPDAELVAWFSRNRSRFDGFIPKSQTGPYETFGYGGPKPPQGHINTVFWDLPEIRTITVEPGKLRVTIYEEGREFAGFIYSPSESPPLSVGEATWIEDLGGDWYFVRALPECTRGGSSWHCVGR